MALVLLTLLSVPPSDTRFVIFTNVSSMDAPGLRRYLGKPVRLTRLIERIEFDGDTTRVVFEETDEQPEVSVSFNWWVLPYEFEEDILCNPQFQYTVTVLGILSAKDNQWVIASPRLLRWE